MTHNKKIFLLSFSTTILLVLTVQIALSYVSENSDIEEVESVRLTSVGIPQVVLGNEKIGEQKVILADPSIQKNWGLMGTNGQSDIKANKAWDITQGDRQIIVAIIDTGIDIHHPDLQANIWKNPGETGLDSRGRDKSTNGIDDDGNGYTDDANGWDFVNDKPNVADNHGHGTHIAGIVGASGGKDGKGIFGACPKVSLMALKYFDPASKGNDNLRNTVRAIRYAVLMGAKIINYSGGGTEPNDDEFKAVKFAADHGVLFVAAAGNEHSNSDSSHYYPADYNLSNIISVTAIDKLATILKTSNYGSKTVHIGAPGEGIKSTLPNGKAGFMTGTSQATAFVSGVAALVMAHNKDFNDMQVKQQIVRTADEVPGLRGKTASGGKLNSYAALAMQPAIPATGIASVPTAPAGNAGVINASRPTDSTLFGKEENTNAPPDLAKILKTMSDPVANTVQKRNGAQAL